MQWWQTYIQHTANKLKLESESVEFTSTHLPWVRSFHALHTHALGPGSCVTLLWHPLSVSPKRPHALAPGLVHSHGRPAHGGCIHACAHVPREGWRAAGSWLVHELAVVRLVWCHLERGTHLEDKTGSINHLWVDCQCGKFCKWIESKIFDVTKVPNVITFGKIGTC